jgi:arylsulfatase
LLAFDGAVRQNTSLLASRPRRGFAMKRLTLLASLVVLCVANAAAAESLAGRKPNIIFLITDDQGYGDISAHGNPVLKTPNLDKLHDEGVRFTDFHVSPTCSPTRSSLMSGKHEFKNGVTHTILERERMSLKTVTLPQVLKTAGYTTGIFGKWHLGDEAEYQPGRRGFDEVFIHGAGGIGQTYPGSCGDAPGNKYFNPAILHNGKFEQTEGYCTDVFFSQATKWIDGVRGKQPFFCYIATNAPHGPYVCRKEDLARYRDLVANDQAAHFLGMVANIDDNVGRLLGKLKEWDLERDTLFIFMNDNGGTAGVPVFNAGLHGQKGTPFRGGTKASSFWRWPGALKPADCDRLAAHIDIFPTLAEIAGAKLTPAVQAQFDGRSLTSLLADPQADWDSRILFTHVGRWPKGADANEYKFSNCSVRNPQFNLVSAGGQLGDKVARNWKLYDLKADPGETTDVAWAHPDVVKELTQAYDQWWAAVVPLTLENNDDPGPQENPFKVLYEKQYGAGARVPLAAEQGSQPAPTGPKNAAKKKPQPKKGAPAEKKPAAKAPKAKADPNAPGEIDPNPAFKPVVDDPKLPRVLLIGDSISIGYTVPVQKLLQGKANVHRIPTNGGPTTNGTKNIAAWLGDSKWDVIHFNWGLHDVKYMPGGDRQVSNAEYEKNLRTLIAEMQKTGATLIWCSTTPVPAPGTANPTRKSEDVPTYNEVAAKVVKEFKLPVDDLYTFAFERLDQIQIPKNVHFTPKGSDTLAEQVAKVIEQHLPKK